MKFLEIIRNNTLLIRGKIASRITEVRLKKVVSRTHEVTVGVYALVELQNICNVQSFGTTFDNVVEIVVDRLVRMIVLIYDCKLLPVQLRESKSKYSGQKNYFNYKNKYKKHLFWNNRKQKIYNLPNFNEIIV